MHNIKDMGEYNHWRALNWATGLPLELKLQHFTSVLELIGAITYTYT